MAERSDKDVAQFHSLATGPGSATAAFSRIPLILAGVWLVGLVLLVAGLWHAYVRKLSTAKAASLSLPDPLRHLVAEEGAALGLNKLPQIWLTEAGCGPCIAGFWNCRLIIPAALWNQLSTMEQRLVVRHELTHLARRDQWTGLLQTVVQLLYWFHPAVWYASREISRYRELCCDEELLSRDRMLVTDYARCLIQAALNAPQRPAALLSLSWTGRVAERVTHMTRDRVAFRSRTPWFAWAAALLAVAILLPGVGGPRPVVAADETSPVSDAAKTQNASETPTSSPAGSEFARPKLIAVTWQQQPEANDAKRVKQAAWRPDGTLMSEEETERLQDQLGREGRKGSFNAHWWDQEEQVRPLVCVFAVDKHRKTPLSLLGNVWAGDEMFPGSSSGRFANENDLALVGLAPHRDALKQWPQEVSIVVQSPTEDPQILVTRDSVPKEAIEVDRGVRWFIDSTRGQVRSTRLVRPPRKAAVLEIDRKQIPPLANYRAKVWIGTKEVREDYVTMADSAGTIEIRVSEPIDDPSKITKVEITRQRHRLERYDHVKTRLDLLPDDPKQ
jgi:beta-lactamase regulating signal transducer with metallopeptidase domain